MSFETITYTKEPPLAFVTLNRPDKLNALSETLQLEVREALHDAGLEDDGIRVIVLKAAGRAFSAGFDLSGGGGHSSAAATGTTRKGAIIIVRTMPCPRNFRSSSNAIASPRTRLMSGGPKRISTAMNRTSPTAATRRSMWRTPSPWR